MLESVKKKGMQCHKLAMLKLSSGFTVFKCLQNEFYRSNYIYVESCLEFLALF